MNYYEQLRDQRQSIEEIRYELKTNALRRSGIYAANQYLHNVLGGEERGLCGTAIVLVMPQHDGRTKKGKAERKTLLAMGFEKSRSGAFKRYGEYPSQSVEVKEIEARAMADFMRREGFKAFTQVFLD